MTLILTAIREYAESKGYTTSEYILFRRFTIYTPGWQHRVALPSWSVVSPDTTDSRVFITSYSVRNGLQRRFVTVLEYSNPNFFDKIDEIVQNADQLATIQ